VRALNALAAVIATAQEQGKQTPMALAVAVDSAQMLMCPETAADLARLRDHMTELVARRNDDLAIRGLLSPNGGPSRVPMPLERELAPVVEWLLNRVSELEQSKPTEPAVVPGSADAVLTVWRAYADYGAITLGTYTSQYVARTHCEDWLPRYDATAEHTVWQAADTGEETWELLADDARTGLTVQPIEVPAAYDAEADE
jgi:hypothetical protein